MRRSSLPWIVSLSVHIYRWLLAIGPADFRREYEEQVVQVFRQYCQDIYCRQGTRGVIRIWLPSFSEALADMLAERFSRPESSQERCGRVFYSIRHSMVTVFCAFVLFATAYVCLHYMAASQAQFSTIIVVHSEIELAFAIIKYSTNAAFLAIALGGLPILFIISKRAIASTQNQPVLPFLITAGQVLALFPTLIRIIVSQLGYSIVVNVAVAPAEGLLRAPLESVLSFVFLADMLLLIIIVLFIGTASPTLAIPQLDFAVTLLRFARTPMIITTFAMGVALMATALWATRVWMVVPELSTGGTGGSILFLLIFAAMALSCVVSIRAIRSCMNIR